MPDWHGYFLVRSSVFSIYTHTLVCPVRLRTFEENEIIFIYFFNYEWVVSENFACSSTSSNCPCLRVHVVTMVFIIWNLKINSKCLKFWSLYDSNNQMWMLIYYSSVTTLVKSSRFQELTSFTNLLMHWKYPGHTHASLWFPLVTQTKRLKGLLHFF